ncbi:efflux RND transporter periplasmic adaptor subunit [Fontivita pretiosa]|uniref:efflux RND transporter periplasmic adaptor subunit n=1 Tax=Fontivita pretiosa TaxID=2989684 RepID=UPI003D17E303
MNLIALPTTAVNRRWTTWLIAPVVIVAFSMAGYWAVNARTNPAATISPSMLYTLHPMDLDIKVIKDGELQAVNNIEIVSQVEGQTVILTLVKEGTSVKKGDVLMTLDSSTIDQRIEDTTLELQKAEADLTTAKEMLEIQESTNAANLEAAEVALTLAQLDLKQYVEGTYPQLLANARTELEMARINLKTQEEKLGQTKTLYAKGFVTATAVKDDELAVTTARNAVTKAETALKVLTEYTHQMDLAAKQNAVSQAEQRLVRTKRENASNLAQRIADVRAKENSLAVLRRRMEKLLEQKAACTIRAPADGLVVYATSGDRNAQNPIQEGATVRERQSLLKLPDTSQMKAVIRVQEGQVAKLREGMRARVKIVGIPQTVGATLTKISVLADSAGRWWSETKEYPVDLVLDEIPPGAVLKPGMGALAEILVDRATNVLAAPLSAIYSTGPDSYVFVRQGEQFVPRKVRVGRTNETHAELLGDTIQPGDELLLLQIGQGQELLERAGIKSAPATQPRDGEFRQRRRGGGQGGDRAEGRNGAGGPAPGGTAAPSPAAESEQQPPAGQPRPGGRRNRQGEASDAAAPAAQPAAPTPQPAAPAPG